MEEGEGKEGEELRLSMWEEDIKEEGERRFGGRWEKESEENKESIKTDQREQKYEQVRDLLTFQTLK